MRSHPNSLNCSMQFMVPHHADSQLFRCDARKGNNSRSYHSIEVHTNARRLAGIIGKISLPSELSALVLCAEFQLPAHCMAAVAADAQCHQLKQVFINTAGPGLPNFRCFCAAVSLRTCLFLPTHASHYFVDICYYNTFFDRIVTVRCAACRRGRLACRHHCCSLVQPGRSYLARWVGCLLAPNEQGGSLRLLRMTATA